MQSDEVYQKVIESARDIKYMRNEIEGLKRELKEQTESCHKRISRIQDVQNLNVGKITVILVGIGAATLACIQVAIWFLDKIVK